MKVVFDEEARHDLDRIYAWVARDDQTIASAVIDRVINATEHLGRFSRIGHVGRARGTLEWLVHGLPFIIVYEISDELDELIVIGIFHGAQERRSL